MCDYTPKEQAAEQPRQRRPYDETLDVNETGPAGQELDCHGKCVKCGERPREAGVSVPSCLCGAPKQAAEPSAPACGSMSTGVACEREGGHPIQPGSVHQGHLPDGRLMKWVKGDDTPSAPVVTGIVVDMATEPEPPGQYIVSTSTSSRPEPTSIPAPCPDYVHPTADFGCLTCEHDEICHPPKAVPATPITEPGATPVGGIPGTFYLNGKVDHEPAATPEEVPFNGNVTPAEYDAIRERINSPRPPSEALRKLMQPAATPARDADRVTPSYSGAEQRMTVSAGTMSTPVATPSGFVMLPSKLASGGYSATTVESLEARVAILTAERDSVRAQINTPEVLDFIKAVQMEAAHQRVRWGTDHDAGKTDADWYWLLAHIAGKALHGVGGGDNSPEKHLHRIATIAAVAANWHLYKLGKTNMRPGTASEPNSEETPIESPPSGR